MASLEYPTAILVFGYYHKQNWGDDKFADCFRALFPKVSFTFVDESVPYEMHSEFDALWIGGGCLMQDDIPEAVTKISGKLPTAIIGVDRPSDIGPNTKKVLRRSKVTLFRFEDCPDLHFALPSTPNVNQTVNRNAFQVYANSHLVPHIEDPLWKHQAHQWFVHEFSNCLDTIAGAEGIVSFSAESTGKWDDLSPAHEFRMRVLSRRRYRIQIGEKNPNAIPICMRLHSAIRSVREGNPPVCITAHDKMKKMCEDVGLPWVDYYGFRKREFFDILKTLEAFPVQRINEYTERARKQWLDLSATLSAEFSL